MNQDLLVLVRLIFQMNFSFHNQIYDIGTKTFIVVN